jgi:hypothetical protein
VVSSSSEHWNNGALDVAHSREVLRTCLKESAWRPGGETWEGGPTSILDTCGRWLSGQMGCQYAREREYEVTLKKIGNDPRHTEMARSRLQKNKRRTVSTVSACHSQLHDKRLGPQRAAVWNLLLFAAAYLYNLRHRPSGISLWMSRIPQISAELSKGPAVGRLRVVLWTY